MKRITLTIFFAFIHCLNSDESKVDKSKIPTDSKQNSNWSESLGKMNWKEAKNKCEAIKMRLPQIKELKAAFKAGITESWKKDGEFYWYGEGDAYRFSITDGLVGSYNVNDGIVARCISK